MMQKDSLYRVSLKALIRNANGEVLIVHEKGQSGWSLPGGGMDHGETLTEAMKRELYEEVGYEGEFAMRLLAAEDAQQLKSRLVETWQLRLIYEVTTENQNFSPGEHAYDIKFVAIEELQGMMGVRAAVELAGIVAS